MEIQSIRQIRDLYLRECKKQKTVIVIQHNLAPHYNPVSRSYNWDTDQQSEWIVKIGSRDSFRHSIMIKAMYSNIQNIMTFLLTGKN